MYLEFISYTEILIFDVDGMACFFMAFTGKTGSKPVM